MTDNYIQITYMFEAQYKIIIYINIKKNMIIKKKSNLLEKSSCLRRTMRCSQEEFTFLLAVHGTTDTAFTAISIDYISI